MLKTSNPQINHLIEAIEDVKLPSLAWALIASLVEECNHKDQLLDGMKAQIPG